MSVKNQGNVFLFINRLDTDLKREGRTKFVRLPQHTTKLSETRASCLYVYSVFKIFLETFSEPSADWIFRA